MAQSKMLSSSGLFTAVVVLSSLITPVISIPLEAPLLQDDLVKRQGTTTTATTSTISTTTTSTLAPTTTSTSDVPTVTITSMVTTTVDPPDTSTTVVESTTTYTITNPPTTTSFTTVSTTTSTSLSTSLSTSTISTAEPTATPAMFFLRSHVSDGTPKMKRDSAFENLYISDANDEDGSVIPTFTSNRAEAYAAYYDADSSSIAFDDGTDAGRGLTLVSDDDSDAYSPAFITDGYGTARMDISWGELIWANDRFGSWLACPNGSNVDLLWWDVTTNQLVDQAICTKIQLLVENLD